MKRDKTIMIVKANGEVVPFAEEKLRRSLGRTGVSQETIKWVVENVKGVLYDGIPSKKIYQKAFSLLRRERLPLAARYKLKQGIMELGPSGFPFEKYIGEILKIRGFSVVTGSIVEGKCVSHEVDVMATRNNDIYVIECKYHNRSGYNCDVKIPLYVQSRFLDIYSRMLLNELNKEKRFTGWVVTNTRFTGDAIKYAACSGLKLLGWDFPKTESLRQIIDEAGLYPLTCLTTLTRVEKQRLLDEKIVLCREIRENEELLNRLGIKAPRLINIIKETQELCKGINEKQFQ